MPGPSPPRERQEGGWGDAQDGKSGDQRRAGREGADEAGVGPWRPLGAADSLKRNVDSMMSLHRGLLSPSSGPLAVRTRCSGGHAALGDGMWLRAPSGRLQLQEAECHAGLGLSSFSVLRQLYTSLAWHSQPQTLPTSLCIRPAGMLRTSICPQGVLDRLEAGVH